jgi:hypothetical protein
MGTALLLVESLMTLGVVYLAVAATVCVVLGRKVGRPAATLRILISWLVPILGPFITIRVSAEELQLSRRWWLWPLKGVLSDTPTQHAHSAIVDMQTDAERILPGGTLIPPP